MSIPTEIKPTWWQTANKILTSRRLSYAIITGAALWITWLASIIFGAGNFDLARQVVGTDYIQFYAAGQTVLRGDEGMLYDFAYQSQLEVEIAGIELANFHAFLNPPFLAWLFVPFAMLPYQWSFLAWSSISVLSMYASIRLLGVKQPWRTCLWSLCWFPVFATISFGQNSLVNLLILSLAYYLWRREHTFLAGLAASLILFKPQLVIGVALLWLIRWRRDWKALLGLLVGGGILGCLMLAFLPEATLAYIQLAVRFIPRMIYSDQFPLYHLHALRGFWILLFPRMDTLAEIISLLIAVLALLLFIHFLTNKNNRPAVCYAAAIALTIFITPHAMIYDWALLLITAILFWQALPQLSSYWKAVFSVVWLITLLSGPLTYLQMFVSPIAIQISVPILCFLLLNIRAMVDHALAPSTEVT